MDIVQLIIMVVGFIVLGIYQHYKIKTLQDQTIVQTQILKDLKIYTDMIKPEILKYRVEQHEKLVEKERDIAVKEIQEKFSEEIETELKKSDAEFDTAVKTLGSALISAMCIISHTERQIIVNEMEDIGFREYFQAQLPKFKEYDRKRQRSLNSTLVSGGTGNQE